MKYCRQCGAELEEGKKYCPQCGTKCEEEVEETVVQETEEIPVQDVEDTPPKKKNKKLPIIVGIVAIVVILAGIFGAQQYSKTQEANKDKEAAQRVEAQIDAIDEASLTADSRKMLDNIRAEYDALSKKQQKLVGNYGDLENAYKLLDDKANQDAASALVAAIDAIDPSTLTASDTSVANLRKQYEALTDEQKALVGNASKLDEFDQVIQGKAAEDAANAQATQAKKDAVNNTFANLMYFEGFWGDFGAANNAYQGQIESAIKAQMSMTGFFGDADSANSAYMELELVSNGPKATDKYYIVTFEGYYLDDYDDTIGFDCIVESPDELNFVCHDIDYF